MGRASSATVPLSVIDDKDDGDGELLVMFDWTPGEPARGFSGPPEDYDPGSADEIEIICAYYLIRGRQVPCGLAPHEKEKLVDWLQENWDRPDLAADRADFEYERRRDERGDAA